jgi:hypothetical protein
MISCYHLRAPFMPASSCRHLMRDNYEPIVNAELKLGGDPQTFRWVMVPPPPPPRAVKSVKCGATMTHVKVRAPPTLCKTST